MLLEESCRRWNAMISYVRQVKWSWLEVFAALLFYLSVTLLMIGCVLLSLVIGGLCILIGLYQTTLLLIRRLLTHLRL